MIKFMRETNPDLYYIFILMGTVLVSVWNLLQLKKIKQHPSKLSRFFIGLNKNEKIPVATITAVAEIVILTVFQYVLAGEYNVWFGKIINMGPNYYGTALIGPFMLAAVCFVFGIDVIRAFDLIAPSYAFGLVSSKIGCFAAGCCNGIEWEHGLYNYQYERFEVPVQLIESGLALLVFVILVLIRNKTKPGTLFPLYLILYSSTRFCSEFLRSEPDILGNLKLYHLCCLAGVVFGIVFLIIALLFADKISALYTREYKIGVRLQSVADSVGINYHQLKKKTNKKNKQVVHHKKKRK